MSVINLLIDHRNTEVTLRSSALKLARPNQDTVSIPLNSLASVVVIGRPMISCDVWHALNAAGIPATLLPARGNAPASWLGAGFSTGVARRQCQYAAFGCADSRRLVAGLIVEMKLTAMRRAAVRLLAEVDGFDLKPDALTSFLGFLDDRVHELDRFDHIDELRGLEGTATRSWFALLRTGIPANWNFNSRNRRPPRDPFNSLLSLSYSLATGVCQRAVHASGLDPQLGLMHDVRAGRPALALDVVESLRPGCDVCSLHLLNGLNPEDFRDNENEGCRLGSHGRRVFFDHWFQTGSNWPDLVAETGPLEETFDQPVTRREIGSVARAVVKRITGVIESEMQTKISAPIEDFD